MHPNPPFKGATVPVVSQKKKKKKEGLFKHFEVCASGSQKRSPFLWVNLYFSRSKHVKSIKNAKLI